MTGIGVPNDSTVGWISREIQTQKSRTGRIDCVGDKAAADDPKCRGDIQGTVRYEIVGKVANVADRISIVVIIGVGEWKFAAGFLQCSGERAADIAATRHRRKVVDSFDPIYIWMIFMLRLQGLQYTKPK